MTERSSEYYDKEFGVDDAVRERTGIYAFGFNMESLLGFLVPGAIVFGIGAIGGFLIFKYL
ncbi:MAG: hypothetical protein KC438_01490 [Thermomicrobiales bacterium]|nr:hypothetical protein [Thermomicrobiales bacterium]